MSLELSKEAFEEMLKAPFKNDWKEKLADVLKSPEYGTLCESLLK